MEEVIIMNTLSVNIHLGLVRKPVYELLVCLLTNVRVPPLQVPFYQPTKERYKILMEEQPFPSDLVSSTHLEPAVLVPCS